MAYTKYTLADCKQSLADKHDSGTLPTDSATLSYWVRLINQGVKYCADNLRLEKSTQLTTVSGTIALPTDFLVINDVRNSSDIPLEQVSKSDVQSKVGLTYWITGNHTDGFYLNTPSDETYTIFYSYHVPKMTVDADICIIPDIEAPVLYAYSKLRKAETDPLGDADSSMGEAEMLLKEMQDQLQINDKPLGFTIID
jgi:hypothetical protein